ncbi:MAG: spore gernimation protein GerC [Clostridia bacterium]|nr:spore gernimation protein GerC [Clostridia bacterium]
MKKVLWLLPVLCLLSGCSTTMAVPDTHEIESTILMRTLGVDVGSSSLDGLAVTASSGERSSAGTQQGQPPTVLFAQADTISAACQKIQTHGDEFVFFGDVEQLVVGEGQAQRSLDVVLAHVARAQELRLEAQLWVVRGGAASDVLFLAAGGEGKGASDRLEAMREDAGLFSRSLPKTAREALVELSRNGCTFAPALALTPKAPGNGAEGEAALTMAGYAVFRDGALAGWTDPESSRGVNLVLGRVDTDILELTLPSGGKAALKISGARTKCVPVVENGRLTGMRITCKIEAGVTERRGDVVLDQGTLSWLETRLREVTTGRIQAAVGLGQSLDADYLGLLSKVELAAPWHKELLEGAWGEAFRTLAVDVTVEANVARE